MPNFNSPHPRFSNTGNFQQIRNDPLSEVNNPNIAALLSAMQNNETSQSNTMMNHFTPNQQSSVSNNMAGQQLQNQMLLQQLNQHINNNTSQLSNLAPMNDNQWIDGNSNDFDNSAGASSTMINNGNSINVQGNQMDSFESPQEYTINMTMPLQNNERQGGTSLARSQRIGLKNSFTRRPNSHRQLATDIASSLMSLDSLNLDDIDEK